MQQFGNRIGQATGADIVRAADRVERGQRHAGVDDFLTTALHFRVVALHRGEIQFRRTFTAGDRTGGTATQPDQHRRAAQHHDRVAGAQQQLFDLLRIDCTDTASQHDRLVVAAQHVAGRLLRLETAEVAGQRRTSEFVVERGRAKRAFEHDLQRRRHARIERALRFPRLRQPGNPQMRYRKPAQPGLRPAAAPGRALVADFTAGTGAGAGERRDRGRVIMGFHLDRKRRRHRLAAAPDLIQRIAAEASRGETFDHRGVVLVGAERELRRARMGVADHREQAAARILPVQRPAGVEDLVPAMLGIGLREHHQLGIGRITAQCGVAFAQIVDLVGRQRQSELAVGLFQPIQRNAHDAGGLR